MNKNENKAPWNCLNEISKDNLLEIERLRNEVIELKKENEQLKTELSVTVENVKIWKDRINNYRGKESKHLSKINNLKFQLKDISKDCDYQQSEKESLIRDNRRLNDTINNLNTKVCNESNCPFRHID